MTIIFVLFNPDNEYISRCLVVFCFPGFKLLLKIVLYYYLINVINQTVLCFLWRVIAVFVFYYLRKIGCCFLLLNCYHAPFVRFVVSSGLIIFKCRSCVSRYGVGQMKGAGGSFFVWGLLVWTLHSCFCWLFVPGYVPIIVCCFVK